MFSRPSALLRRVFNLDPKRDFGFVDEIAGLLLVVLLASVTVTAISGATPTTWTHTTDTDFAAGQLSDVAVLGSGDAGHVGLVARDRVWEQSVAGTTKTLHGVGGASATDAWAVGEGGTILRWDGTSWSVVPSGATEDLWSVAVVSATDVWAVGDSGAILRWNGSSWSRVASGTTQHLLSVAALSASDAWAVGEGGTILHWNGIAWLPVTSGINTILYSIAPVSATDAWTVGDSGTILRWNGSSFARVASGTQNALFSIAVVDATHGTAVGESGTILRWNGLNWALVASGTNEILLSTAMTGTESAWAVGDNGTIFATQDGATWTSVTSGVAEALYRVSFIGSVGWAVGTNGMVLQLPTLYALAGTVTGSVNDADGTITALSLAWNAVTPSGTEVKLQLASNDDATTWKYVGPDGTEQSYFTAATGVDVAAPHLGKRYIRYRAFLSTTDARATPLLNDVSITVDIERGAPPKAPILTTPTEGATVSTLPLAFTWSVVAPAVSYAIQIDTKKQFSAPLATATITDPSYLYEKTLPDGAYFWRVRAINAFGESPWSAIGTFTIDRTPPAAPTNLLPESGATVPTALPSFTWSAATDAVAYEFQLNATDPFIVSPIVSKTIEEPIYTVTRSEALAPATIYSWRVRSRDSAGNRSAWTVTRTFTVAITPEEEKEEVAEKLPLEEIQPEVPSAPTSTLVETIEGGGGGSIIQRVVAPQLVEPTANALLQIETLAFRWEPTEATASYTLQIDRTTAFSSPIVQTTVGATSYTHPTPLPAGSYFWRVLPDIATTAPLRGDWSGTATFTLTDKPPLPTVASATLTQAITVDSSTVTIEGIAFPHATVRLIITSNIVEKTVVADDNGAWQIEVPRPLFASGQHLVQAQIFTQEGQVAPATSIGEFFIPFPPPPPKNAAVATARAIGATATKAADAAKKAAKKTAEQTVVVAAATERAVEVAAPVAVPTLAAAAPVAIAVNPATASSLPVIPNMAGQAFSWFLSALGIRKKRKNPWGMVYDAITKEPIGLAIIRLFDTGTPITKQGVVTGQAKQLLATQVTDKEGRFEFLVKPGTYTLGVVKTPYVFPSTLVPDATDGELLDIYHGGAITITSATQNIHVSIPLDPEDPAKRRIAGAHAALERARRVLARASLPLLVAGTAVSIIFYAFTQTQYNLLMLLAYIVLAAYQTSILPKVVKAFGTIFDATTLQPVPLALVHVIDPQYQRILKSRLSDYRGRFTFLPNPGTYELRVVKQGYIFPSKQPPATRKYKKIYTGGTVVAEKKKSIIAVDVPLDPVRSRPAEGTATVATGRPASNGVDPFVPIAPIPPAPVPSPTAAAPTIPPTTPSTPPSSPSSAPPPLSAS